MAEQRDHTLMLLPKKNSFSVQPSTIIHRQNPTPISQSIALAAQDHEPRASRASSPSPSSSTVATKRKIPLRLSTFKNDLQQECRDELPGHYLLNQSIECPDELRKRNRLPSGTGRQMAYEGEITDGCYREEQQSRQRLITHPNHSAKKPEGRAEAQVRLYAAEIEASKRINRTKEKQRRELRQLAKRERKRREQKEVIGEVTATQKFIRNSQSQVASSSDIRIQKSSTPPRTDPAKEPESPSKQSEKLCMPSLAPTTKEDISLQNMLGTMALPEGLNRATVSVESQQSLSSLDKVGKDDGKMSETLRQLQSNSVSPILFQTDSVATDDRPLELPAQTNIYEDDIAMRLNSMTLSPKLSATTTLSSPSILNDSTSIHEHNISALGITQPPKPTENLDTAGRLAPSESECTEQTAPPLHASDASTKLMTCATSNDTHGFQAAIGPTKDTVLLSSPRKRDVPEISTIINSLPIGDRPKCRLRSTGDSCAGDPEEQAYSSVEMDGESEEAFDEDEISVKSALDTAMNVVKGLLLRELLDCALPEATDALEGSGSLSSTCHGSSSASSTLSSCNSNFQTAQRRKRTRSNGRGPGDGDDDGSDDDDRPKKKNEKGLPDRLPYRRLKCPFYQRQPEKYTKAACRGEGFADMAKLKDHIKRVHTQPLRCSRCWLEMKSEDAYSEHIQQEDICKKKIEPLDDRIRPQMLKRLDFKKAPYVKARNVEERWNMLFSVLFPNDTDIPSPYEQKGMSPRLERALSEALEEELARELAPILEPIMSRIKKLIPTIIESCRLKLMRTSPSSEEETIFTPSAVLSGVGSSDGEPGSSKKQAQHRTSSPASRCSGSSFEVVPIPEEFLSKVRGRRPERTVPSTTDISVESQREASSPGSSTDFSGFHLDGPGKRSKRQMSRIEDSFEMGDDGGLSAIPRDILGDGNPTSTERNSATFANTHRTAFGPYDFVEDMAQFSNVNLPDSHILTWPSPGYGLDSRRGAHRQPGGEQLGSNLPREQEPSTEWDLMMHNFDFSSFPNS